VPGTWLSDSNATEASLHNLRCVSLQPLGRGHVRLSKSIYNFTERQDVRLAVGYRGTMDDKGNVKGVRLLWAFRSTAAPNVSANDAHPSLQACTSAAFAAQGACACHE
jgi:hypothetical protein